ncbi:MAG: hypothetical protein QOC64_530 [Solirubrobacteraceae bacterium]|nr:hypothetical protein [Solirubrobacteraceae bacterium]
MSDRYALLAALTEAERELAVEGRFEELPALQAQRAALVAELPAQAPASAEPHLRRAAQAQAQVTAALTAATGAARTQVVRLEHGRGAVAAYRPLAPAAPTLARRG